MVDWVRVRYFFIIFREYLDAIAQRPANSLHLDNDDLLYLKGNNRIDTNERTDCLDIKLWGEDIFEVGKSF